MPDSISLVAAPDDLATDASGRTIVLHPVPGTGALAAGWYSVQGSVAVPAPRVQLVAGAARPVPLGLLASGAVAPMSVLRLPEAAASLTLRAGDDGRPERVSLQLRPIGRGRAIATMLAAHRRLGGARALPALVASLAAMVSGLAAGGTARAAGRLHARYDALVRRLEGARRRDSADPVTLRVRHAIVPWPAREVALVPADDLRASGTPEAPTWRACGSDPKFVATPDALGTPLAPGWYRLRARLRPLEGHIVGPCLYPDHGRGESEGAMIPLGEPDARGRLDVLLVLRDRTRGLRFDPTMREAHFEFDDVRLQRLGRLGAFAYMFARLGTGPGPTSGGRLAALSRFARDLPRRGLSAATTELFRQYHECAVNSQTSYASWVSRYDTFSPLDLQALRERAAALADGPRISIVVPVYETPEPWLRRCLDSVLAQAYANWELCIADDASPSPHVRRVIADYVARDARIRAMRRERNGHISQASNSALALATGQFVGLLDHDDELRPHTLLEVAEALHRNPDLKVIYSDEDKIDEEGRRFDPYFKPDWNPDLLRGQNYLCHFSVLDAGLVRDVGGFREGYEGSQDHDLLLRCTERVAPAQVHHIPRVLYHWRAIAGSTALVRDAKDYAADAGARAVADHLVRIGADARVEQLPHGHYRVHWGLGPRPPKASLVIPTRDRADLLRTCVESLLERTDYPDFEIVVVDNQSREPEALAYLASLEADGRARVLRYDAPFNYSAINNWAVARCDGAIIGLLNNDLEVISPGWLREMASHALRPEIGAVGAMLYYPDDTMQHAGVILGIGGVANHAYLGKPRGYPGHGGRAKVAQGLSAVTAACLVVRRDAYERVGGLDESLQVAFNDVDFCLRLRQSGLRNLWTPFAEFYHHESATRGSEDTPEKAARFRGEVQRMESRWREALYFDPAYNPNLTLFGTDFGYGFPPRVVRDANG